MLVVGPSAVFVEYIARVLPSLGEDTATLRSLGQLVEGVAAHPGGPAGGRRDQGLAAHAPGAGAGGPRTGARRARRLRLLYRGELLRLERAGAGRDPRRTALPRGARRNEVRRAGGRRHLGRAVAAGAERLPCGRREAGGVRGRTSPSGPSSAAFLRAWWPVLRPAQVLGWLADPAPAAPRTPTGVLTDARRSRCWPTSFGREPTRVADVALLDELDELLGRPAAPARRRGDPFQVAEACTRSPRTPTGWRRPAARRAERPDDYRDYAHVVVDEAQDVSPMQWRMLGRRGRHATWTIVGDPAQAAWAGDPAEADPGAGRGARQPAPPDVHADHQLPQLGGDLRAWPPR